MVAGAMPAAHAADATTLVSGFALPANLDPHQVFDVPMQAMMLNAYDNLYRYQNDPPEIVPWLAESHTVTPDGLDLGVQAAARHQVPRRQRRSLPRTWSTASAACWRWRWGRPAPS